MHVDDFTHKVVKRGIKHSSNPFNVIKEVEFKALGRNFRLILHPHREVLHHNFKAYVVNSTGEEQAIHFGESDFLILWVDFLIWFITDHNHLYRGRVFGELDSHVNAHIDNGVITAVSFYLAKYLNSDLMKHLSVNHTARRDVSHWAFVATLAVCGGQTHDSL